MVKVKEETVITKKSYLLLEDGNLFEGISFGANTDTDGEIGKLINCQNLILNSN
jgi:hypothetical protein